MAGSDLKDLFDFIKLNIINIALCLFLLIGVAKLLVEELKPLVVAFKKLLKLVRK